MTEKRLGSQRQRMMSKRNEDTKDLHLSRSCQKDQTVTCSSKVKDVQFGANFQTLKEKGGNPLVIQWLGLYFHC